MTDTAVNSSLTTASKKSSYNIVVIGGSAGAISVLKDLLNDLPANFSMPILVIQHLSPTAPTLLVQILQRHTKLSIKWAEAGERPEAGIVYISPPNRQMLIAPDGTIELAKLASNTRWGTPVADTLFESAALVFGEHTISIILSGALYDGTKGTIAIRAAGGLSLAQSVATSHVSSMPEGAIDFGRAEGMSIHKLAAALKAAA